MRSVLLAIVMLGLVGCGTQVEATFETVPTPTPTTSTGSPLPAPSADQSGPFGPIWQMNPEEAFQPPGSCENLSGLPTSELGPNVAYRISRPGDWVDRPWAGDCMLFAPEPFEPDTVAPTGPPAHRFGGYWVPEAAAIWILVQSGGDYIPDGSVISTEEYTIDGVPAIRYEIQQAGGVVMEQGVVWVIGVAGRLPSAATDSPPYLAIATSSSEPAELARYVDVLDRMAATLQVLEP